MIGIGFGVEIRFRVRARINFSVSVRVKLLVICEVGFIMVEDKMELGSGVKVRVMVKMTGHSPSTAS